MAPLFRREGASGSGTGHRLDFVLRVSEPLPGKRKAVVHARKKRLVVVFSAGSQLTALPGYTAGDGTLAMRGAAPRPLIFFC